MAAVRGGNGSFLKHLNIHRTPHVIVAAEDDEFDDVFLQQLQAEGFNVQYVAMGEDKPNRYADRLHQIANHMTGISEQFAIIAFGDAAAAVLETHVKATPRLCALVAYYPSAIPDPGRTRFPMNTAVLVHMAGQEITVRKTPEILGVQGKRKSVRKRVDRGVGMGGELRLSYPAYKYEQVEPGFAEHDLEEFDPIAEDLAWSRTLQTLRDAFGMKIDLGRMRDDHMRDLERNLPKALEATSARAKVLFAPTVTGAISPEDLRKFYANCFSPSLRELNARLISRTDGVNRVVDEIYLSFRHDKEIHWLLPGVPPTGEQVEIIIVSIVCIKGGLLAHERIYWDQASVLVQVGLLDPKFVPPSFQKVESLPVAGAESARAVLDRPEKLNMMIKTWNS